MTATEAKKKADELYRKGLGREDIVRLLSSFEIEGEEHEAFEYVDALFGERLDNCPDYRGPLPIIICNDRHLREKTADALQALYQANNPEKILYRGGALCRVGWDEFQRPTIELLSEAALRGRMDRSADFITYNAKGEVHVISPPLDVVRDIASLGDWQFPALLGITETPVVRPDGTILNTPGYDPITHLFYTPTAELKDLSVNEHPTADEVQRATEQVTEIICDFPFVDKPSHANAVAAMMLPVIQPLITLAPMVVIDKPQPGTGASLLADIVSIIASGRPAATMGMPRSEEECEKKLNSHLLEGRTLCVIDNVDTKLWSDTLARFLTSHYISVRPLGRSADLRLQNNLNYIITGNNVQLGGDLPRRCFWIRLDAQIARPWLRGDFRHPRLLQFVSDNRGSILGSLLTLARGWITKGRPTRERLPPLGSYERFVEVASGILDFMGVEGFLENLSEMYEVMDKDTEQWEAFLSAWLECLGDTPLTVRELMEKFDEYYDVADSLPDKLVIGHKEKREGHHRRLGNALSKRAGVLHPNGLVLRKAGLRQRAVAWKVETRNSPQFVAKSELSELSPFMETISKSDNNIYIGKVGTNSPDSLLKLKPGELTHSTGADQVNQDIRTPDFRHSLVEFWRSRGAPLVHLGPGENCEDLKKLLSDQNIPPRHLKALKNWALENGWNPPEEGAELPDV